MRAIILAAGRGSRMKHLTDDNPKCLVELHGRTLLDKQIESLHGAGITEISIVTGYKREMLVGFGLKEFHNPRWAETNMVSSLACAKEWLEDEPCIVSYSDIFFPPAPVSQLMECEADIAVTFDVNWLELWQKRFEDPLIDAETFRLNEDGTLAEIGKKPGSIDEIEGQYMGLLRIAPAGWAQFEKMKSDIPSTAFDQIHMTGALQNLILQNEVSIVAVPFAGSWGEIDSADDLIWY